MKGSWIILKKELFRVFGDRKLIFSLFILPAIMMIVIYSLMGNLIGKMESDIEEHTARVYMVEAPDTLKGIAKATGYEAMADIKYMSASEYAGKEADIRDLVLNGGAELIVIFDKDFETTAVTLNGAVYGTPGLKICYNSTENYSSQANAVFRQMVLETYRTNLLGQRLGDLSVLTVFTEDDEIIAKEEKVNTQFVSMMLPYLIVMLLFSGAMSLGVDAIAGEKERGTLSSMLLSPVKRSEIVLGKILSLSILSGLSAIIYAVSMIIAFSLMGDSMGGSAMSGFGGVKFGLAQSLELLVTMLVLDYFYIAIVAFLSVLAKDSKTASTLISPVYIVVILMGVLTMFNSGAEIPLAKYAIPIYGNALCIRNICTNELLLSQFGVSLSGIIAASVLLTVGITKAFNSEKVMFNA